MRHEVPLPVPDPFIYIERNGSRHVVASSLEVPRLRELPGLEVHAAEEFGVDELIAAGMPRDEIDREIGLRACRQLGVAAASVPPSFPLAQADYLRAGGVQVDPDRRLFRERRRVKSEDELTGIRRAQRGTEAAMEAARDLLRRAEIQGGSVLLAGEPLTCERIRAVVDETFTAHGLASDEAIISHGPQTAIGHEMGHGPIAPDEPVLLDLFPRDRETGCYADMTRVFVVGEPPAELVELHERCLEVLRTAIADVRPGVLGRDLHVAACELFQSHGYPTQLSKTPGTVLEEGFFHALGHGVGLEVHEGPGLGLSSRDELVPGDVITIEPGLYRPGFGGVRLEDLVLVTESGAENLTKFPYDLQP
jgi:Xaa-Pro aminopeptidase